MILPIESLPLLMNSSHLIVETSIFWAEAGVAAKRARRATAQAVRMGGLRRDHARAIVSTLRSICHAPAASIRKYEVFLYSLGRRAGTRSREERVRTHDHEVLQTRARRLRPRGSSRPRHGGRRRGAARRQGRRLRLPR